jgi:beta-mannosidase
MHTITLNGTWSVRPESITCFGEVGLAQALGAADGWLPAQVPGEIHLDLIRAGQMAEPAVGANMPDCRWPETKSWWHRTTFEVSAAVLAHERLSLMFDGLDLYAQVFLNGKLVGEAADAFVPVAFEVNRFLKIGQNELVVRLTAGSELAKDETPAGQDKAWKANSAADGSIPNPIQPDDPYGHRLWAGRKWLRKPQFTYGWDWVDALPNIGIWRGVHLEARSYAILHDLRLDTLLDGDKAQLEMDAVVENLHPWSERPCLLDLEIVPPDGGPTLHRQYPVAALPGRNRVQDVILIPEARLWWPNGMGDQPLYQVKARVTDAAGATHDQRQFSIGLRTIQIDRSPLPPQGDGSRFLFRVNGQEVFCRGANIGPHDPILARISNEKYERLVAEARDAHMNMIRINGCSIFEAPAFYDACDRAGILIWHDFPLTDITYPDEDRSFVMAVRDEIETALPLLRHHPSIALWCGNNENTWFFTMLNPDLTRPLDIGGQKLYYQVLPDACAHLDPRRPYWPSSPCGGEDPNSELEGNCHWWFPFFMNPDVKRRIRHEVFDECRARFVTEYGVIGPCHLDSMQEYLAPGEMQPGNIAWQLHTNMHEKETMAAAIRLHYTDPEPLAVAEYILYGQLFQALIHEHAMEALRFRKADPADDCQGALIWSYSDCWGETGWSILDYYLRRKASYYGFRRACRPVKVIVRRRGEQLITRLINDTLRPVIATLEYGWHRLDGRQKVFETRTLVAPPNSMLPVGEARIPAAAEKDPRQWIYAAVLSENSRPVDQSIWTLLPHRELALPSPDIKAHATIDGVLEVSSPVYCHAVHVEDHGHELISDNWFDLLPGVARRVKLAKGSTLEGLQFKAVV